MADIKLTKNELRDQQERLKQLQRYLPTLQLKKAMLQTEVADAQLEINRLKKEYSLAKKRVDHYAVLLSDKSAISLDDVAVVESISKRYENIAGVDVPVYESTKFRALEYSLFDSPPWVDAAIIGIRGLVEWGVKVGVAEEKKSALEKELREVSIRVNLFEKVLIPRCKENIKKIKIFLGDQQLAAVSQAKVAKTKIEENKVAAHAI